MSSERLNIKWLSCKEKCETSLQPMSKRKAVNILKSGSQGITKVRYLGHVLKFNKHTEIRINTILKVSPEVQTQTPGRFLQGKQVNYLLHFEITQKPLRISKRTSSHQTTYRQWKQMDNLHRRSLETFPSNSGQHEKYSEQMLSRDFKGNKNSLCRAKRLNKKSVTLWMGTAITARAEALNVCIASLFSTKVSQALVTTGRVQEGSKQ